MTRLLATLDAVTLGCPLGLAGALLAVWLDPRVWALVLGG
jgi:hypothetical protein